MKRDDQKDFDLNPYRVLETRSNASPAKIKERYIEKVRQFPPEQYPEEFRNIRAAYDILKNPTKKDSFDLQHKYGGKVQRIFDKARQMAETKQLTKAATLIEQALELAKDNVYLLVNLAVFEYLRGRKKTFHTKIARLKELLSPTDMIDCYEMIVNVLLMEDKPWDALELLRDAEQHSPGGKDDFIYLWVLVYEALDQNDKAMEKLSAYLSKKKRIEAEQIKLLSRWYDLLRDTKDGMVREEDLGLFKDLLDKEYTEEERHIISMALEMEKKEYEYLNEYSSIANYLELLYILHKDPVYREEKESIALKVALEEEMHALTEEKRLYPPILVQALELFYQEVEGVAFSSFIDRKTLAMVKAMDDGPLAFLQGLHHLEEWYPAFYEAFYDYWQDVREKYEGELTPEDREQLKILEQIPDTFKRQPSGTLVKEQKKVGRNEPCPCGSGKKYKKCCG